LSGKYHTLGMWWLSGYVHWVAPDCNTEVPSTNPASPTVSRTGPGNMTNCVSKTKFLGGRRHCRSKKI
jgi:hypothetical protein